MGLIEVNGVTEVAVTIDWRKPVRPTSLQHEVMSSATLNHLNVNVRSERAIDACIEAARLHAGAVAVGYGCMRYDNGEGLFPCGISLRDLEMFS